MNNLKPLQGANDPKALLRLYDPAATAINASNSDQTLQQLKDFANELVKYADLVKKNRRDTEVEHGEESVVTLDESDEEEFSKARRTTRTKLEEVAGFQPTDCDQSNIASKRTVIDLVDDDEINRKKPRIDHPKPDDQRKGAQPKKKLSNGDKFSHLSKAKKYQLSASVAKKVREKEHSGKSVVTLDESVEAEFRKTRRTTRTKLEEVAGFIQPTECDESNSARKRTIIDLVDDDEINLSQPTVERSKNNDHRQGAHPTKNRRNEDKFSHFSKTKKSGLSDSAVERKQECSTEPKEQLILSDSVELVQSQEIDEDNNNNGDEIGYLVSKENFNDDGSLLSFDDEGKDNVSRSQSPDISSQIVPPSPTSVPATDFGGKTNLRYSVGHTRTALNENIFKLGLKAKFGQSVVSSNGKTISQITLNEGWNYLPRDTGEGLKYYLTEGPRRLSLASPFDPSVNKQKKSGIPVFWCVQSSKKGGAKCHYIGHYRCVKFTRDLVGCIKKGKLRQALLDFVFVKFDETLSDKLSKIVT